MNDGVDFLSVYIYVYIYIQASYEYLGIPESYGNHDEIRKPAIFKIKTNSKNPSQ